MHIYKTRLKVLLRTKVLIFWTLLFPIVLSTFFYFAFSNIMESETLKPIPVGIIQTKNTDFNQFIDQVSKDSETKILIPHVYQTEEDASVALKEGTIQGYYLVDEQIHLTVKNSGMEETILKYMVDTYQQNVSTINHLVAWNPTVIQEALQELNSQTNYMKSKNDQPMDITVLYFYSLLGMVCLYGSFFGINAVMESEANMSKKGARISIAPTNKWKTLMASLMAGFTVQFIETLILLGYFLFILQVDFGTNIPYVLLMLMVGTFAGITMGTLIGVSNRKDENMKIGISLSITMLLSFLAGLMMENMKYIVAESVPILAKINPVAMITDGLYSLYYNQPLDRYFFNIISLLIFSVVMIIFSYQFMRRKKYDSI